MSNPLPMYMLYEVSIILVSFPEKKREEKNMEMIPT